MAVEDFQWTLILGVIGMIIGLLLPSGLDILGSIDYTQAVKDPINFFTGYVIAGTSAIIIELFSTLIGGLVMGIVGLIIDLLKGVSSNYSGGMFY